MTDEITEKQERIFAGYHLLNRVSISERAELYQARHTSLAQGKRFLVKRFRSKDGVLGQALSRRCAKLRSLSHPLIPPVLDAGSAHGYPYIARSYTQGITLHHVVRQLAQRGTSLPLEHLMSVLLLVLDAVEVAHVASTADGFTSLTHGDLSTSHILMRLDGTPLILGYETPRGVEPHVPAPVHLDVSVLSAVLFGHVRVSHGAQPAADPAGDERRPRLLEAVRPIIRRGLGLDPQRAFRSPGELANALRGCLDYAGYAMQTVDLVPTLESLADVTQNSERTGPHAPPASSPRTSSAPLSPAIDVGTPEDAPLTRSPLDEVSVSRRAAVPAPVDFGERTRLRPASPRAHPLPAFEVEDGNEALAEETARAISETFADILDPFDDVSAEYDFTDASNPFGFEAVIDQAALAAARTRSTQRIGNVLAELGYVRYADVRAALERQGRGVRLGEALVQQGLITEVQLVQALGVLHDLPVHSDAQVALMVPPPAALAALPTTFMAAHRIVPLAVDAATGRGEVLLADPTDREALVEARVLLEVQDLGCSLATRDAIDALIARLQRSGEQVEVSGARAIVLLVDPDEARRRACANRLRGERFVVEDVASTARARRIFESAVPAAVIVCATDLDDGLRVLAEFRSRASATDAYAALAGDVARVATAQAEALGADLLSLPLRVDYIATKVRRALARRQSARPAGPPAEGVRGHLGEMSLLELVQVLRLGRRTATVQVDTVQGMGEVALRDGSVVHATFGLASGDEAFVQLALIKEGQFVVVYHLADEVHRTVFASTESLLIDAARRGWFEDDA